MAYTLAQQLEAVETAIYQLVSGKVASYSIDGISYTYHDLDKLKTWRQMLKEESENDGKIVTRAIER